MPDLKKSFAILKDEVAILTNNTEKQLDQSLWMNFLLKDKDSTIAQQGKEITFLGETRNRTEFKNIALESEETLCEENGPTMMWVLLQGC